MQLIASNIKKVKGIALKLSTFLILYGKKHVFCIFFEQSFGPHDQALIVDQDFFDCDL